MKIDARGVSCPQPVLMTMNALNKESHVEVLVDNNTAKENITRFASNSGCKVTINDCEVSGEYAIIIDK